MELQFDNRAVVQLLNNEYFWLMEPAHCKVS